MDLNRLENSQLHKELQFAANLGLCLFPIKANGKVPLVKEWQKIATKDTNRLLEWESKFPQCNWGVATGGVSGVFVLDVDGPDGIEALNYLQQEQPQLPKTLEVSTARGRHLYFRWPEGNAVHNSASKLAKRLDIRGEGGYAIIPPSKHPSGSVYTYGSSDGVIADAPDWLLELLREPAKALPMPSVAKAILNGTRNVTLTSLAGTMRSKGFSKEAIKAALLTENQHCQPPLPESEVCGIAESVARYSPSKTRRPAVICLADVKPEAVEWLWEPYIPMSMLTLLSGDPGVGKTTLAMAIAASMSRGEGMVSGNPVKPSNVLYLTQENSPEHVLRPRFDALGGDPNRFFLLRGTINADETEAGITLKDIQQLEEAITTHQAKLVVIDPLQSFLGGGVDAYRANETRPILDGLNKLAERTGCAILVARHLSKGIGGSALYRGMGSIDFTAAARSELFVATDPENSERVIMAHSKTNLSKFGKSLVYSIGKNGSLTWQGESDLKANDLLLPPATSEERTALEEAEEFVQQVLREGPQPSKRVEEQAKLNGISPATLRRAKRRLGVMKVPGGFGQPWTLSLPSIAQDSPELFTGTG